MSDDSRELFEYRWGWHVWHLGRGRWMWFSAGLDFRHKQVHVVIFGLAISWGRQIDESRGFEASTTTEPLTTEEWGQKWGEAVRFVKKYGAEGSK